MPCVLVCIKFTSDCIVASCNFWQCLINSFYAQKVVPKLTVWSLQLASWLQHFQQHASSWAVLKSAVQESWCTLVAYRFQGQSHGIHTAASCLSSGHCCFLQCLAFSTLLGKQVRPEYAMHHLLAPGACLTSYIFAASNVVILHTCWCWCSFVLLNYQCAKSLVTASPSTSPPYQITTISAILSSCMVSHTIQPARLWNTDEVCWGLICHSIMCNKLSTLPGPCSRCWTPCCAGCTISVLSSAPHSQGSSNVSRKLRGRHRKDSMWWDTMR